MKKLVELTTLFLIGAAVYYSAEMLIRGRSHWTMAVAGGICFLAICGINEVLDYEMPFLLQMLYGAIAVTATEFIFGCVLNLWLKLDIWDYSNLPGNILGQICPQFTVLWFFVSGIGIVVDDLVRWKLFGEEKPHYKLLTGGRGK